MEIKRVIPLEEFLENEYEDMADLAIIFNHEVVETDTGVWRWKPNLLMARLETHCPAYTPSDTECNERGILPYTKPHTRELRVSVNLNDLWRDLRQKHFRMEEMMKYYMQIGMSLSGFGDVFGQREAAEFNLEDAKKPENKDNYTETIIDYMRRIHAGKILKL